MESQLTEQDLKARYLRAKPNLSIEEEALYQRLSFNKSLELTEDEQRAVVDVAVAVAITEAKRDKGQREYNRLYAKITMSERVYPDFTAKEFFDLIVSMGLARSIELNWSTRFTVDSNNKAVVDLLALYFSGDVRFNQGDYRLSKGLLLIGDVGCGKTQLMNLCRENPNVCYTQHACAAISAEYQKSGVDAIEQYVYNTPCSNTDQTFGHEFYGRFFDDLGAESSAKNFGTERNVMAEIISKRYDLHDHYMTHFTSNLTLDQLEEVYGIRVADRLREMCNVIEFPASAKSRRK